MPTRPQHDDVQMSFTPDLLSIFPPPTGDTTWLLEPDAHPAQMQMPISTIGSADIEVPDIPDMDPEIAGHIHSDTLADPFIGQDSPAGYKTPNDSSPSVPVSRSPSTSSALFLWSSSLPPSSAPHHRPPLTEVQMHAGGLQAKLCTFQRCGPETCLTAALHILTILHIARTACLSAHREALAVQQTRMISYHV
ncbi:hypothetical protein CSUB01_12271 [Colletotrichum sublineola]|uniref:Uncharacterized protein n=1 Tax=Colletotrichum sublineola TaxID=1173701 RepID=A0A066Y2H7_COLSU|nr:hypothetical protein CSUB01_12271 [Colletotrichum sublineola]